MSKNKTSAPLRRSTRQSGKALSVEPTPRGPLKRTKRPSVDQPSAAVKVVHEENGWDDEESPSKKHRFDFGDPVGDGDSENEMDVEDTDKEKENNTEQKMDIEEDSSNESSLPKICKDTLRDVNLSPRVVLGQRCRAGPSPNKDLKDMKTKQAAIKQPATITKSTPQIKPLKKTEEIGDAPISSMDDYRRKMEGLERSTDIPKVNHFVQNVHPLLEKSTMRQRVNNIPRQKEIVHLKKPEASKKTVGTKSSSGNSCRGFVWYLWRLIFLLLLSSATLLAYSILPVLQRTADKKGYQSREVKPGIFSDHLSLLKTQFPSQRAELWKRCGIHLEKHLKTAEPTEPVSLIFTAGLGAKRTLDCLARGLASVYSSSLNASVLHLDGASKSGRGSDEVKLDIDNQLRAAFEGDKPAAVIHRFEELPPGCTLIFYRYCDHENAAYKKVFLLFTVLLPQDEIEDKLSLEEVEELVHDYVEGKQVGATSNTGFNEMDIDKFSGLWSRISHLVLPVVPEDRMEQEGCPKN